jgi:prepilin-type N-terminal cleavage/methylation domain-containing protein
MKLAHLHPWGGRKRRGLSLQEMLIVVAVFAILAIVFMFSSKELMIRTKISRAHSDLQSLITAIDTRADGNGDLRDYTVRVGHANRFTILPRNMTDVKSIPEDVFSSVTG